MKFIQKINLPQYSIWPTKKGKESSSPIIPTSHLTHRTKNSQFSFLTFLLLLCFSTSLSASHLSQIKIRKSPNFNPSLLLTHLNLQLRQSQHSPATFIAAPPLSPPPSPEYGANHSSPSPCALAALRCTAVVVTALSFHLLRHSAAALSTPPSPTHHRAASLKNQRCLSSPPPHRLVTSLSNSPLPLLRGAAAVKVLSASSLPGQPLLLQIETAAVRRAAIVTELPLAASTTPTCCCSVEERHRRSSSIDLSLNLLSVALNLDYEISD